MDEGEIRHRNYAREREMLALAKSEILGSGDFLPVNRLALHLKIRAETLTPALVEWQVENRIFSIEHEGCSLFPRYAFSNKAGVIPHPEMKEILTILSPTKNSWSVAFWFFSPNGMLGGKRPRDLVSTDPIRVSQAAQYEIDGVTHG